MLLRGVDLAAFAAALVARLRGSGCWCRPAVRRILCRQCGSWCPTPGPRCIGPRG
ncbi:hypothetical protein I551_0212 [Mycobacterium ulcerans str. Harvey]|uniref:Uncharacterized protein n=1 Tax=Mycobacterium ulcerans str. Harvey TaxID=1299332 RepID=A0ABN0R852_MYCUL|nr:hypothetical protein I551_0212 [Mycobacterium ulcerans str. Harvey]